MPPKAVKQMTVAAVLKQVRDRELRAGMQKYLGDGIIPRREEIARELQEKLTGAQWKAVEAAYARKMAGGLVVAVAAAPTPALPVAPVAAQAAAPRPAAAAAAQPAFTATKVLKSARPDAAAQNAGARRQRQDDDTADDASDDDMSIGDIDNDDRVAEATKSVDDAQRQQRRIEGEAQVNLGLLEGNLGAHFDRPVPQPELRAFVRESLNDLPATAYHAATRAAYDHLVASGHAVAAACVRRWAGTGPLSVEDVFVLPPVVLVVLVALHEVKAGGGDEATVEEQLGRMTRVRAYAVDFLVLVTKARSRLSELRARKETLSRREAKKAGEVAPFPQFGEELLEAAGRGARMYAAALSPARGVRPGGDGARAVTVPPRVGVPMRSVALTQAQRNQGALRPHSSAASGRQMTTTKPAHAKCGDPVGRGRGHGCWVCGAMHRMRDCKDERAKYIAKIEGDTVYWWG